MQLPFDPQSKCKTSHSNFSKNSTSFSHASMN